MVGSGEGSSYTEIGFHAKTEEHLQVNHLWSDLNDIHITKKLKAYIDRFTIHIVYFHHEPFYSLASGHNQTFEFSINHLCIAATVQYR